MLYTFELFLDFFLKFFEILIAKNVQDWTFLRLSWDTDFDGSHCTLFFVLFNYWKPIQKTLAKAFTPRFKRLEIKVISIAIFVKVAHHWNFNSVTLRQRNFSWKCQSRTITFRFFICESATEVSEHLAMFRKNFRENSDVKVVFRVEWVMRTIYKNWLFCGMRVEVKIKLWSWFQCELFKHRALGIKSLINILWKHSVDIDTGKTRSIIADDYTINV